MLSPRLQTSNGTAHAGQAMVEFALILPIFLVLLIGFVEMARMTTTYILVGHAAREAATYASTTTTFIDADTGQIAWTLNCNSGSPGTGQVFTTTSDTDFDECASERPNVVATVLEKTPGVSRPDLRVTISYQVATPIGVAGLAHFSRSVPVTVTVEHAFKPIVASFVGLPTTVQIVGRATALTQ